MKLSVFASHWGAARHYKKLPELLDQLKVRGFAGLEASLSDLGATADERAAACEELRARGLRLIVGLYSSWDDYEGPWKATAPDEHLAHFEAQLDTAAALPDGVVAHANAHFGCDAWPEDVGGDALARALALSARFLEARPSVGAGSRAAGEPPHLTGVSYETHRGRTLGHPFVALRLLEYLEPLRLTADVSHWHVVAERFLDDDATAARLDADVAPVVDHVHARVGTTQAPQLPAGHTSYRQGPPFREDDEPESSRAVAAHARLWRSVWDAKRAKGAAEALACCEYGPPPYQTHFPGKVWAEEGDQWRDLWLQNVDAKSHLEHVFHEWSTGEALPEPGNSRGDPGSGASLT